MALSEDQKTKLKNTIKKQSNGEYATKICYGCGDFESDPDGNVDRAIFVSKCRNCIDLTEFEES